MVPPVSARSPSFVVCRSLHAALRLKRPPALDSCAHRLVDAREASWRACTEAVILWWSMIARLGQPVTPLPKLDREPVVTSDARAWAKYAAELIGIAAVYFALAKAGLLLASIHPSATPVWPPAGFALAAILLRGLAAWPAIFIVAVLANATNAIANVSLAGQFLASSGIAIGNTLEAAVTGYLIATWSGGARTF